MDFSKLSTSDLDRFLSIDYGIPLDPNLSKVDQAAQLYEELEERGHAKYPPPVWDLWYASWYDGPTDVKYTRDQIMKLTKDEVKQFDHIFQFDAYRYNLQHNRRQIYRILKLLDLIQSVGSTEFLNPGVLNQLCQTLPIDDLNNLRLANHAFRLDCQIRIHDPDNIVQLINALTSQTYNWIKAIENEGSINFLLSSANEGNLLPIKFLIGSGVDPNSKNKYGGSALVQAAANNHIEIVDYLIKSGMSEEIINDGLSVASYKGHLDLFKYLIEQGADLNNNFGGMMNIHLAALGGHVNILDYLYRIGIAIDQVDDKENTPLILASQNGHLPAVEFLLSVGANINHQNQAGETALYKAVDAGHDIIVNYLLQNGADPNINVPNDLRISHLAYSNWKYGFNFEQKAKFWNILVDLINSGVDINYQDRHNISMLYEAVDDRKIDVVKLLLERGANPNFELGSGITPLLSAVKHRDFEIVELLLKAGADQNIKDNIGNTVLSWAEDQNDRAIVNLLNQYRS